MLETFLKRLVEELGLEPPPPRDKEPVSHLSLSPEITISIRALDPGFLLFSKIGPCPEERREELFILLMKANFLGQGTGGSTIALDDENFLTLSLPAAYDMSYNAFKDKVEDFANYIVYWREALISHQNVKQGLF
jgi:hypothetical protein